MANRFTLEHFRNNTPIVDPKTGLPTEYFLRMMFGNTEVGSDQQATVEQNAMDIDTLEIVTGKQLGYCFENAQE